MSDNPANQPEAQAAKPPANERPWPYLLAAALIFGIDRLLKDVAYRSGETAAQGNGILDFRLFMNDGIVFSLKLPDVAFWLLVLVATIAIGGSWWSLYRSRRWAPAGAMAFILIGGLSNIIDRLAFGAVIDYLILFGRSAVNMADGMILGGALAAYFLLREKKEAPEKALSE